MRTNAIVRIVLFSLAILVLLGILVTGIFLGMFMVDTNFSIGNLTVSLGSEIINGTVSSSGTVDADQIDRISIDWAAGSITVQPGDVEDITFQETGSFQEDEAMVWNQNGKTLEIQFCRSKVSFGISYDSSVKDLVITVPRDWNCAELELDAASAKVMISDLSVNVVDFDGASGTLTLENCSVEQLDIDTASGDVRFTGTLLELDCDAASADITCILVNTPTRIDMDMASGDLDLTLPENCGFTLSMDTLSSDFTSDFATSSRNGSHIYGDGRCKITVDGMSGDVIIRKG